MNTNPTKSVAIIVAHPDDEILWAGGTILNNPDWKCYIISLCRKNDEDRCNKFFQVLKILNADGNMGNLDDEPEQKPIENEVVKQIILDLLPKKNFDIIITHNPKGEYTKHLRHEEVSKAVIILWNEGKIATSLLWTFAYEDGSRNYFPKAISNASYFETLSLEIWLKKHKIITEIYGFDIDSWEAKTTPKAEAFWIFNKTKGAIKFLNK
jgi:LmbE family N-acetylglucosaminyl deacetylase